MKLDTAALRYLTNEDWRVLTAVEIGSKNHEVVPTPLIIQLSHLRSGSGVHKSISILAKANLIARTKNAKYDGYRLTYGGLDYLALHTHLKTSTLYSTGNCIGAGKESDIYVCAPPPTTTHDQQPPSLSQQVILKIHRLGRISFRSIKNSRDYLGRHRTSASWMYMSRLSAQKEFTFMKALWENGFPVPRAIAQSRHTVVMEMVGDGVPLRSVRRLGAFGEDVGGAIGEEEEEQEEEVDNQKSDPAAVGALYASLLSLIVSLAERGLIHGDFNEFNVLISPPSSSELSEQSELHERSGPRGRSMPSEQSETSNQSELSEQTEPKEPNKPPPPQPKITLIDFPQTLSTSHPNATFYFDRDVACIKTFFRRRFGFTSGEPGPFLPDVLERAMKNGGMKKRLDVEVEASGFSRKMGKELEKYMKEVGADGMGVEGEGFEDGEGEEVESEEDEDDDDGEDESSLSQSTIDSKQGKSPNDVVQGVDALSIQVS